MVRKEVNSHSQTRTALYTTQDDTNTSHAHTNGAANTRVDRRCPVQTRPHQSGRLSLSVPPTGQESLLLNRWALVLSRDEVGTVLWIWKCLVRTSAPPGLGRWDMKGWGQLLGKGRDFPARIQIGWLLVRLEGLPQCGDESRALTRDDLDTVPLCLVF